MNHTTTCVNNFPAMSSVNPVLGQVFLSLDYDDEELYNYPYHPSPASTVNLLESDKSSTLSLLSSSGYYRADPSGVMMTKQVKKN